MTSITENDARSRQLISFMRAVGAQFHQTSDAGVNLLLNNASGLFFRAGIGAGKVLLFFRYATLVGQMSVNTGIAALLSREAIVIHQGQVKARGNLEQCLKALESEPDSVLNSAEIG